MCVYIYIYIYIDITLHSISYCIVLCISSRSPTQRGPA